MNAVQTPEWVKHAVFYQIYPDRFAISDKVEKPSNIEPWDTPPTIHGFKGGDLLGVAERLDYLVDLGVNAIYFNPIFQSASNHRYHTHDYYKIDPILGGFQAFKIMLDEAHKRNIRVVLDGVFNHASRGFFQFNHIMELGEASPYLDWFSVKSFPVAAYSGEPNYDCWVNLPALPRFNFENPQVRRFIFDVARYWLEQGIDGWRLDVPFEIKDEAFWQEFRQVVKSVNPEAYIVGEIAWEAQQWLQGDQFDAVMNYQFMQACLGFFAGERIDRDVEYKMMGLPATAVLDAAAFDRRAHQLLTMYPHEIALAQLNLLDSHDMPRYATLAGNDPSALRLSAMFQMTYPGAPCIYYGTEIGMQGGQRQYPEASRATFPWDTERWDQDLRSYYQSLIRLRHAHPALRTGEFITLYAQGQGYAYLRQSGDERLVVALNSGDQPLPLDLSGHKELAQLHWQDALAGGDASLKAISLPPRSGNVFLAA